MNKNNDFEWIIENGDGKGKKGKGGGGGGGGGEKNNNNNKGEQKDNKFKVFLVFVSNVICVYFLIFYLLDLVCGKYW